jgi:hypothetical protein
MTGTRMRDRCTYEGQAQQVRQVQKKIYPTQPLTLVVLSMDLKLVNTNKTLQSMRIIRFFLFAAVTALLFTSCLEDECTSTRTFVQFEAVYIPVDEIRPGINVTNARDLVDPGNIYYYKKYLLVNERREGVHIIDNSDPSSPVNIGFIEIPGNLDMAVKNDILYSDLYLDLVAIDISDPMQATIAGRTDGVFSSYYPLVENAGYLVEYVPTERTIVVDCNEAQWGSPWFWRGQSLFFDANILSSSTAGSSIAEATGVGGSMARFTIAKDFLYTLDGPRMRVFDIDNGMPELENTVDVEWGIETLFPYKDYLFIGANAGMFIMDNTIPTDPKMIAEFRHARSCDPVFVTDDVAYVTLRGGSICQGFQDQLDVIDVSDIESPSLIKSYPMQSPYGLSVTDETLFLCEGQFGLKVYSVEDNSKISSNLLDQVTGFDTYDVIALDNGDHLIVVGEDGIYQYDSSDRENLHELSRIEVNRR